MARGLPRRCRLALPLGGRLRCEPACAGDQRGVLRDPTVGSPQLSVGRELFIGLEHCRSAAAEKVGPSGAFSLREPIEAVDEFVVELDEDFTASHRHMIEHMVRRSARNDVVRAAVLARQITRRAVTQTDSGASRAETGERRHVKRVADQLDIRVDSLRAG